MQDARFFVKNHMLSLIPSMKWLIEDKQNSQTRTQIGLFLAESFDSAAKNYRKDNLIHEAELMEVVAAIVQFLVGVDNWAEERRFTLKFVGLFVRMEVVDLAVQAFGGKGWWLRFDSTENAKPSNHMLPEVNCRQ